MATMTPNTRKLGVFRLAVTGALAAVIFYVLCWIGTLIPLGPVPHMYLQLFTTQQINSVGALAEGVAWSAVFGLIAGALVAFLYNALAIFDRR